MFISRCCIVKSPEIRLNGSVVYKHQADPSEFLKSAFRNLNAPYPKFFKMDNLSKLAFVAVEYLLKEIQLTEEYLPEEIGIILQNSSSSLETDEKHQESISDRQNYFPSPSVFVYTLPNIMVGEMAIKHKFKGENAVIVSENPDPDQIFLFVSDLLGNNRAKCCITGYVESYHAGQEAMLMLVEMEEHIKSYPESGEIITFAASHIERIFKEA